MRFRVTLQMWQSHIQRSYRMLSINGVLAKVTLNPKPLTLELRGPRGFPQPKTQDPGTRGAGKALDPEGLIHYLGAFPRVGV